MTWILVSLSLMLLAIGVIILYKHGLASSRRRLMLEEQRVEAVKHKKIMEALIATEGWKMLVAAAQAQQNARKNEVLLKPTDFPMQQEFAKGEIQGIELFLGIPKTLIETSKAIIEIANEQVSE